MSISTLTRFGRRPPPSDPAVASPGCLYAFLAALAVSAGGVALLVFRGYVLGRLWAWFVEPACGLSVPPLAVCCGLMLVARLLRGVGSTAKEDQPGLAAGFALTAFLWYLGYVVVCVSQWHADLPISGWFRLLVG